MTILPGGKSIGDAIFPLSLSMLSPYRGVAYHRSDYDGSRTVVGKIRNPRTKKNITI